MEKDTIMTMDERQQEIVDEFGRYTDWEDRYRHLIRIGKALPAYPEEFRTGDFLIKGCQSQVWVHPSLEGGRVHLVADSDAAIVRGLIALLLRVYSDAPPDEILTVEPVFVRAIGLAEHLSPTRSNGLSAMMKQIKLYGLAYKTVVDRATAG